MALTLKNCTLFNNTGAALSVVPNAPGQAFPIPIGGQANSGNITFDTIQVPGDVLDTEANFAGEDLKGYFNIENGKYVLSIPDTFAAIFD